MWQISSGYKPFYTEEYDVSLALEILKGKRENIIDGTPIKYSNLYTGCWNYEEGKRPNMQEVVSTLKKIIFPEKNDDKTENYLTVEKANYLESSEKTSLGLNNDLLLENISNIINSKSSSSQESIINSKNTSFNNIDEYHCYETEVKENSYYLCNIAAEKGHNNV
ncbi:hypothetical protein C1645_261622 [Glomus cerebriforme]|uniref:Serine-threonine/tyrosine-protein kinase catalytic domain-containing protein n=1 Tax=Glomus cerebriforme TaxID=658196 RepID=A0A397SP37_9GLOM|nr:hypothetical protein C1645_261622 [Glomus cerebriforme]